MAKIAWYSGKGTPFWEKYELENNNEDTLYKMINVSSIFSNPLGRYEV